MSEIKTWTGHVRIIIEAEVSDKLDAAELVRLVGDQISEGKMEESDQDLAWNWRAELIG